MVLLLTLAGATFATATAIAIEALRKLQLPSLVLFAIATLFASGGGVLALAALVQLVNGDSDASSSGPTQTAASSPTPISQPATAPPVDSKLPVHEEFQGVPGKPVLSLPSGECVNGDVTFSWLPGRDATNQWIDLSVGDAGFTRGASHFEMGGARTSVRWPSVPMNQSYTWRINDLMPDGSWHTSDTGAFVPCGPPALFEPFIRCSPALDLIVNFRWAPSAVAGTTQYLDISTDPRGFRPGTFVSAGPFPDNYSSWEWPGIRPWVTTYYRVNALTPYGWLSSEIRHFDVGCLR